MKSPDGRLEHYLIEWRAHAGKTQAQVAADLPFTAGFLSQLENFDRDLRLSHITALARAYGIEPYQLLTAPPSAAASVLRLPPRGARPLGRPSGRASESRKKST